MTIHIEKFQSFVHTNGFTIRRIFTRHKYFYIELLSIDTADRILLYIQEKYDFQCNWKTIPIHRIENHPFIEKTYIEKTYIEKTYSIDTKVNAKDAYKQSIIVNDAKNNDSSLIQEMTQQTRRLKHCIKGTPYKLSILSSSYLVTLYADDPDIYQCEMSPEKTKSLYITCAFNVFYDKISTIKDECNQLYNGIYNILNNIETNHITNLKNLFTLHAPILDKTDCISEAKKKYIVFVSQYTSLLEELHHYKKDKQLCLTQLSSIESSSIHHDMKRSHQKTKLEKELSEMKSTEDRLVNALLEIKAKNEHLMLTADSILFDNSVMLEKVFINFNRLKEIQLKLIN